MSFKSKILESFIDREKEIYSSQQLAPHKVILIYRKERFDTGILAPPEERKEEKKKKRKGKKGISKKDFFHFVKENGNGF